MSAPANSSPAGLAVDNSDGSLYVADPGLGSVRKYDDSGAPANFSALGSNELPVATSSVAVDNSGGPSSGDIYVTAEGMVQAFTASGEPAPFSVSAPYVSGNSLIGTPSEAFTFPSGIAVDASGNIYVAAFLSVFVYSPGGEYLTEFSIPAEATHSVAVDSTGTVYVGLSGGALNRYAPSSFPVTASTTYSPFLVTSVAPYGLGVDPANDDLYVDGSKVLGQYGSATESNAPAGTFGAAQLTNGSNGIAVDRSGGLSDGSVYATTGGQVDRFGPSPTPVAPTIESQAADPTQKEVELRAKVNSGFDDFSYRFEYGLTASYGRSTAPEVQGGSEASVIVTSQVLGLDPDTTYHFRTVVKNSVETVVGPDQTFHTPALSAVEFCSSPTPGCWGFEQVTPRVKGAGTVAGIDTFQASLDGESFLYTVDSPFSEVPAESVPKYTRYLGTRGAEEWGNRALDPPYAVGSGGGVSDYIMGVVATSADLSHALVASIRALTPGATEEGGNLYMRDTRTGALTLVATSSDRRLVTEFTGLQGEEGADYVAPDGRSALFATSVELLPGAPSGEGSLYAWTADGGLRAESVLPAVEGGRAIPGFTAHGNEEGPRDSMPHEEGLAHVYYAYRTASQVGPVYVRSGEEVKAISVSHIPGDSATPVPAALDAVGEGGRYALFHTEEPAPLTTDTPTGYGSYLYRYDFDDGSLAYVGAGLGGGGMGFTVLQMTQNGQSVAFQSTSDLAGDAVEGEENMYVWRDGVLHFVETGEAGSSVTSTALFLRVLSPNGRFLSFTDNSISTAQRFGFDNVSSACPRPGGGAPGPCSEVYLYDVEAQQLSCVSCDPNGSAPTGNAGDPRNPIPGPIRMNNHQQQTVSDDGTAFFATPDSLLPADGNGTDDVYAWHEGRLRLVSRATQGTSSRFLDATPDGRTIFIATNDAIAPTDHDNSVDIYVTREGAGFSYSAPESRPPCSGGACREGSAPSPSLPGPSSIAKFGSGNVKGHRGGGKVSVVGTRTVVGSRGPIKVRVSGKGRLAVSGRGIAEATKLVPRAGVYGLRLHLTAGARKTLVRSGKVRERVTIAFSPSGGSSSRDAHLQTAVEPEGRALNMHAQDRAPSPARDKSEGKQMNDRGGSTFGRRQLVATLVAAAATLAAVLGLSAPPASAIEFASLGASSTLAGAPVRQAGAHPDVRVKFTVTRRDPSNPESFPKELPHRLEVELPPGLVGNTDGGPDLPRDGAEGR